MDYVRAVSWGRVMRLRQPRGDAAENVLHQNHPTNPRFTLVSRALTFGKEIYVTRKGGIRPAVSTGLFQDRWARKALLFRGLGNPESFCSCSHGAGRVMSRTKAKKLF